MICHNCWVDKPSASFNHYIESVAKDGWTEVQLHGTTYRAYRHTAQVCDTCRRVGYTGFVEFGIKGAAAFFDKSLGEPFVPES